MININMRLCLFVLYLVVGGCATEVPMGGLPIWDFQAEQGKLPQGIWQFTSHSSPSAGDYMLDFSPPELVATLSQVLDKANAGTLLVPNTLQNLVYPTYDFPSLLKASNQTKWSIAVKNDNLLVTDWKFIPGRKVGFLWWAKEYETQVRHRVIVKRLNSTEPNTNFLIATEVRERPDKNLPWQEGLVEFGRQSFEEIKKLIVDTVTTESKILADVE